MSDDAGCARPTGAVVGEEPTAPGTTGHEPRRQQPTVTARVGRKAPDFEAPAYHRDGMRNVKLSDHLGRWVLLCFYPGDFTFV